MPTITRAQLVDAAENLNEVLDPSPPINVRLGVNELRSQVKEAAALLQEGDAVKASTRAVLEALDSSAASDASATPARARSTNSTPSGARPAMRYEGSSAQRMDDALLQGGTWTSAAESAGVKASQLKGHARFRVKSGKYEYVTNTNEAIKLVRTEAPAAAA